MTDDPVNHPAHYTSVVPGIECIDVTRHFGFTRGNAIKYLWRAGSKGDVVEDLRKAIWYIEDEIAQLLGEASFRPKVLIGAEIAHQAKAAVRDALADEISRQGRA